MNDSKLNERLFKLLLISSVLLKINYINIIQLKIFYILIELYNFYLFVACLLAR